MSNLPQNIDENLVRQVVSQVVREVTSAQPTNHQPQGTHAASIPTPVTGVRSGINRWGVFNNVDQAVSAARIAFEQLSKKTIEDRKLATDIVRNICRQQAIELGTAEMNETKVGRLEHKIEKLVVLADHVPGVEFLSSQVFSGDHGLTVIEPAPFGVIGAVTPVTHSLPTLAANAISIIAAGNSLVVNPHPSGKRIAAEGVRRFNQAIQEAIGIDNLICVIEEPTIESANELFTHRDIALICVTGGPAVGRAALRSGKRAIVAGPGNPPVVVDETADLARAARCIVEGASYDNNLLCIGEKEIFVVESVCDQLIHEMLQVGAALLDSNAIDKLTRQAITKNPETGGMYAAKEFIGQDAQKLANAADVTISPGTQLLIGETDHSHPMVSVEQMMPFVPIVRCRDANEAIELARKYEHGFRHTSMIHSNNVTNMTRMGQILDTTIFVKNGPCTAGNGIGGEGYFSYSIAGPTGEGITTPLTFTRERRCAMVESLRIIGMPEN